VVVIKVDCPLDKVVIHDGEYVDGEFLDREIHGYGLDAHYRPTGDIVVTWKSGRNLGPVRIPAGELLKTPTLKAALSALSKIQNGGLTLQISTKTEGTYSIRYERADTHDTCALDWDWEKKGQWAASVQEGVRWYLCHDDSDEEIRKKSDEEMRTALLKHFGLTEWADEFPFEEIKYKSPSQLAAARRQKEEKFNLKARVEMESDTVGHHVKAEDHPG